MKLQDFAKELMKEIQGTLGENYLVHAEDVTKNNGVLLHALTIRRQGENIAPCIYIDDFYKEYQAGKIGIADAVEEIRSLYRENADGYTFDMDLFRDYDCVRPHLQGRLIHTQKNEKLLETVAHREFLDLSLTYFLEVPGPGKSTGYIQVYKKHLEYWNVEEETLYKDVICNIAKPQKAFLKSIGNVLDSIIKPGIGPTVEQCPAYILSNSNYQDGAVQMLNKQMLKTAAQILNGDFFILPSSINEVILVPMDKTEDRTIQARQFAAMVREVNDTQVEEREILSYHIYQYCSETGEITIAA